MTTIDRIYHSLKREIQKAAKIMDIPYETLRDDYLDNGYDYTSFTEFIWLSYGIALNDTNFR